MIIKRDECFLKFYSWFCTKDQLGGSYNYLLFNLSVDLRYCLNFRWVGLTSYSMASSLDFHIFKHFFSTKKTIFSYFLNIFLVFFFYQKSKILLEFIGLVILIKLKYKTLDNFCFFFLIKLLKLISFFFKLVRNFLLYIRSESIKSNIDFRLGLVDQSLGLVTLDNIEVQLYFKCK